MLNHKDYLEWSKIKAAEHNGALDKNRGFDYKEGEIFWASIGQNIGYEEDGKGDLFTRPVLVIKGFNRDIFWGVPLSSQLKFGKYYYRIRLRGSKNDNTILLSQLRLLDTARIADKRPIGAISKATLREIKNKLKELLS